MAWASVPDVQHVVTQPGEVSLAGRLLLIGLLATLAACKPPPEQRQFMPGGDPNRGLAIVERAGCGACHDIPGVRWPRGKVGPALAGFGDRALIAGSVANRPDILVEYLRNPSAVVPGTGMPSMPLSKEESRDVAAYLYTLTAR